MNEMIGLTRTPAWQRIETAPQEQAVLVTNGRFVNVAMRVNISTRKSEPLWCWYACLDEQVVEPSDGSGQSASLDSVRRDDPPTHWMPLPEPPKDVTGDTCAQRATDTFESLLKEREPLEDELRAWYARWAVMRRSSGHTDDPFGILYPIDKLVTESEEERAARLEMQSA